MSIVDEISSPACSASGDGRALGVMGACYALGVFTDNFYKQAAILMAAGAHMTGMQSTATVLFSLPFILFSAWAGALADRLAKKTVILAVKSLELLALFAGAFMLMDDNWTGILAVMFCMGVQSAFFSPAINGAIPETFAPEAVPRANALIKLASTTAILAGMAAAGPVLDSSVFKELLELLDMKGRDPGRAAAALTLVLLALLGLTVALSLRHRPSSLADYAKRPFPWLGPLDSLKLAWGTRKDRALFFVLLADAWFFGIAALCVISIANLSSSLGYSMSAAGLMTALLMIGVALGSLVAGRFTAQSWRFLLLPSGLGMGVMLCLIALTPLLPAAAGPVPLQALWFGAGLFGAGLCGGVYLIPLESFIQVRPAVDSKGRVIAVSNFMSFSAMALFGAAFSLIGALPPAWTFFCYGGATMCFIIFFAAKRVGLLPPASLRDAALNLTGLGLQALLALRYQVQERGLDALLPAPKQHTDGKPGMLILPNHPALIDPVIVYSRLAGLAPRPLADEGQMSGLLQKAVSRIVRAVTIPDSAQAGRKEMARVLEGLRAVSEALRQGDNVLLYPSGRVYRSDREEIGNNAGVFRILSQAPEARVLLVRTTGLWGSAFSHASGSAPNMMRELGRGMLTLFANALFWTPKRKVILECVETKALTDFVQAGNKRAVNRFLEDFYNQGAGPPVSVPRCFWKKVL